MMIHYQRLLLAIAICFCHYAVLSLQIDTFYNDRKHSNKGTSSRNVNNKNNLSMIKKNFSYTPFGTDKEEQIGRVNRKQYEVVNMLWKRTKFFLDFDEKPTPKLPLKNNNSISHGSSTTKSQGFSLHKLPFNLAPSTPSYIEFYYLDELDGQLKKKDYSLNSDKELTISKLGNKALEKAKNTIWGQHIFNFENRNIKESVKDITGFYKDSNRHINDFWEPQSKFNQTETYNISDHLNSSETFSTHYFTTNGTNEPQWLSILFNDPLNKLKEHTYTKNDMSLESTTMYDKIKFFEMYDSNTIATKKVAYQAWYNGTTNYINDKNEYNNQRYKLNTSNKTVSIPRTLRVLVNRKRNILNGSYKNNKTPLLTTKLLGQGVSNKEKTTVWLEYPYTSVYIYEPLSIYCDAAAISTYWLIAAGSCLSRHHRNNLLNERSAYIAYCGDNWWEPESIAYVRRIVIHPLYRNRVKRRRYLYNIGVVQVISSLKNSCSGWAPVSLASHKFSIGEKGSPAAALGWGLDRYSTRYSYYDLPKSPLAVYKGTIFAKSCPTVTEFRKGASENDLKARNIYCLSLPLKGVQDTSHGSLLMVEGKLIALSLQVRGVASEMSVQYTGLWRLVPWILDLTHNKSTRSYSRKRKKTPK